MRRRKGAKYSNSFPQVLLERTGECANLVCLMEIEDKTPPPSWVELRPGGRCYVVRRPNCEGWQMYYGHPGGITNTFDGDVLSRPARSCQAFWSHTGGVRSADYNH